MSAVSQDILKKIRRIQIVTTQLANDVLAGAYRSAFKGKGMEFEEVREYQPGDEVRSIDWNVTARMNHPYIKTFREERDLTVLLVIDVSASSYFGSHYERKSTLMAEIGGVLAFSAIKNNDKIGLLLFSDVVEKYIPPRKGIRHVLRVIRELLIFQPKHKGSNLGDALAFLGKVQNKRSICFLISDFLCPDYRQEAALIASKHDLIAIRICDPYENTFPELGLLHAADLETNESGIIDTSSSELQHRYTKEADEEKRAFESLMKKMGADYMEISTDKSYINVLKKFFKIREKKTQMISVHLNKKK